MASTTKSVTVVSDDALHPANLICELCADFFRLGWVTGTGGAKRNLISEHVYIAPSGVQKERIQPDDLFVLARDTRDILRKPARARKQSDCTPLFFNCYDLPGANVNACIHTHSQHAVMATLLWPGDEFRISHQEMIKGVRVGGTGAALQYHDTLILPILDNLPRESELAEPMARLLRRYPEAPAVLVRRHGLYVWSDTWEHCKTMTECLDYLLEIGVKMRLAGLETEGLAPADASDHRTKRVRLRDE